MAGQRDIVLPAPLRGYQRALRAHLPRRARRARSISRPPLLERTGLADFFVVSVSGDTTANKKPHPEPVLHACRVLGVPPEKNLHIGDSDNDLLAARAAGCLAWAVPYGHTEGGPVDTANCDALVCSLLEAAQRVAEINETTQTQPQTLP